MDDDCVCVCDGEWRNTICELNRILLYGGWPTHWLVIRILHSKIVLVSNYPKNRNFNRNIIVHRLSNIYNWIVFNELYQIFVLYIQNHLPFTTALENRSSSKFQEWKKTTFHLVQSNWLEHLGKTSIWPI